MKKLLIWLIVGTVVSFYFFPIGFKFLPPTINTKMILAVLGLVFYAYNCIRERSFAISKGFFAIVILCLFFSLWCYLSATFNNTNDYTYATYFSSFFTWLFGAYAACCFIKRFHGDVTVSNITAYLTGVCVVQCVVSQLIDNYPAIENLINGIVEQGQDYLKPMSRLYGIGASLDTAGVRFSVVLAMISYQLCRNARVLSSRGAIVLYIVSFVVISVLGNMIARTTSVGVILGLASIVLFRLLVFKRDVEYSRLVFIGLFLLLFAVAFGICAYLYNTSSNFHSNLRFAFEGFFNWIETGVWRTDSTDKLNAVMWVWPTNTHDWVMGTGIFGHFAYSTDIGYCRFTLYSGLVGLSLFSLFFIVNALYVRAKFNNTSLLALLLTAVTFVVWLKVATDIFCIYAMLISAVALRKEDSEDITGQLEEETEPEE